MRRYTTVFLTILVLAPILAQAQPNLNLKRAVVNWPAVELYFSVACSGVPVYNMQTADFRVHDNGEAVGTFTLSCPDPAQSCPMSVALVFDASGSMQGAGNAGAKQAGKTFVAAMDGQIDEAALLWFSSVVTLQQSMTSDTALLNTAVDSIPAFGFTAVWDGIMAGLQEVSANGINNCRAVVVLSDGGDNSSHATPAEIIAFAAANHIRVFTVGLGSSFNSVEFEQIARLTGGRFYQTPNASQLAMIYQEIASIIHAGFQECSIIYDATCADGALHNVELQLVDFCGGTDSKSKSYRAPLDSMTFTALPLRLGDVETAGNSDFELPLLIDTALAGQSFPPLTLDLCFSSQMLGFRGAEVPIGSPLSWMQVSTTPIGCGIRIQTQQTGTVTGSGELLRLKFHSNITPSDTTPTQVIASFARLETGCLQPVVQPATVTIVPGNPTLNCTMDGPREVLWDTTSASYAPAPIATRLRVFNTGIVASTGGSCEITIDSTVLRRVSPTAATMQLPDIPPGEWREAIWHLDAYPRVTGDSTDITMTARFDNHHDIDCSVRLYIGQSEPVLLCDVTLPTLAADTVVMRYDPNPFPVILTVRNTGVVPADNILASIELPTEMSLAGADIGRPWVKPTDPASLQPGQSATVEWLLYHPLVQTPHSDTIRFRVRADRGGMQQCEGVLDVPPISGPILSPRADGPASLHFDPVFDAYQPNPFTVTLTCVNRGTDTAWDVTGSLQLPAGLELVDPTEPLTKSMHAGPLAPWSIGDPVPRVTWELRWTRRESQDVILPLEFTVGGKTRLGDQLAEVTAVHIVRIPGLRTELYCDIDMPDSLRLNAAGNGVEPNPVPLRYLLRNSGQMDIRLTRVLLSFSKVGLQLDPSSPLALDTQVDVILVPGDSVVFDWRVKVLNRNVVRTARFSFVAFDAEGNPYTCEGDLFIPAVQGSLDCSLQAEVITADRTAQQYAPMPFVVTLDAVSNKAELTDSIRGRIELPAGGMALSAQEAGAFTKALLPARLFPQQQGSMTWMLEHPVSRSEIRYDVRVLLWEEGGDTTFCETEVVIPAIPAPFTFGLLPSGPLAFCEGGSVTLDAGPGYATYLWSTQDTTRSILVTGSGTYWCAVTLPDGLPGLSDQVTVTVHPLPPTPIVTRTGDVLSTGPADAWQWYLDGVAIPNANTQTHTAVETGSYTVRITDSNGCEALSDSFSVGVLPVDEGRAIGHRFHLYPNPADGKLTVDVELFRPSAAVLALHDLLGRELRRIEHVDARLSFTEHFDLRDLEPGVYILQLRAGSTMQSQVLVVR